MSPPPPCPPPIGQVADGISLELLERIEKEADGVDEKKLRLLDDALKASDRHQERLRAARLAAAKRLRDDGVPMTEIAEAARVNDSYLARLIIGAGGARRNDRTRRRRSRRSQPPEERTA